MDYTAMIPILLIATVAGTGIMIYARYRSQAGTADIAALAQRNGWQVDITSEQGGHTRVTRITSRAANWIVEERFSSDAHSSNTTRTLTWTDSDVAIPSGLAVMSLAMSDDKAANMERFLNLTGNGVMGKHMSRTFFGAVADRASELDAVEATGAAGAILATSQAREALLPIAFHEALVNCGDAMPKGAMPTVLRSPEGLHLNLKSTIKSPEQLEAMVDLGETLSAALKAA